MTILFALGFLNLNFNTTRNYEFLLLSYLSILTGCIIAEELAYGCTGIKTAMEASGLGVR